VQRRLAIVCLTARDIVPGTCIAEDADHLGVAAPGGLVERSLAHIACRIHVRFEPAEGLQDPNVPCHLLLEVDGMMLDPAICSSEPFESDGCGPGILSGHVQRCLAMKVWHVHVCPLLAQEVHDLAVPLEGGRVHRRLAVVPLTALDHLVGACLAEEADQL